MKSTVFVRPNLKMFLLGAILIAVVQHFIANGHSQGPNVVHANARKASVISESELQRLLEQSSQSPSSEVYMRISYHFEQRGELRKALRYLRRAERMAQVEGIYE
jgi:hypothetical protein